MQKKLWGLLVAIDNLTADISAQIAGVSKSVSSMRTQIADVKNIGKGSAVLAESLSFDTAKLSKTLEIIPKDMFPKIADTTKSILGVAGKNIEKYSDFVPKNFSPIEKGAENLGFSKFSNVLSGEKDGVKNSITQISTQVKEQVLNASTSMKNMMGDKVENLKMLNFNTNLGSAVTGISKFKSNGFEAKNSDNTALSSEVGATNLTDILTELKAIESAIRGNRQFEKKVL